jgi:imidazoleglycerol-phosphate dehydratase
MDNRKANIKRNTNETQIQLSLNLDGTGKSDIDTGVGFFDHMLTHIARHGLFDLTVKCDGDLDVDAHHTVEDIGICLGQVIETALDDKRGIVRFGAATVPMEDALAEVSVDLCGRPYCVYNAAYRTEKIGEFDVELVEEFARAFSNNGRFNLHINCRYGTNSHHIAEAIFKALGRALRTAVSSDPRTNEIPSTKGVL